MLEKEYCFVSYKVLTEADMGRSIRSHQTHIGLFEDSFLFLADNEGEKDCNFLFSGNSQIVPLLYGRMLSASSGNYRSPKIRKGDSSNDTILSVIRRIAADNLELDEFYLIWFALPDGRIFFWLVIEDSEELDCLRQLNLLKESKGRYSYDSDEYHALIEYLKEHYSEVFGNHVDSDSEEELEKPVVPADMVEDVPVIVTPDNIPKLYKSVQVAIEHYLDQEVIAGRIQKYSTAGYSSSSPYEFTYYDEEGKTVFCPVFIAKYESDTKLHIHSDFVYFYDRNREYKFNLIYICEQADGSYWMKICKNPKDELDKIASTLLGASKELVKSLGAVIETFQIMADTKRFNFSEYFRL